MTFFLIPVILLAIYSYRVQTKAAYIYSGIVLGVLLIIIIAFGLHSNIDTDLGSDTSMVLVGLILLGYGYTLYLAISAPKPMFSGSSSSLSNTKMTSYEKSTAFRFKAGNKNLAIQNPFRGILVVGGAGSGKSRTFIYPIIKQSAEQDYTGILYDFKSPELVNLARACYQGSRVKTNVIDFNNIATSQRTNPLEYIENAMQATNYTQALIFNLMPEYIQKQDFWSRSILSLFSGTIWYFKKNHPQYATLPHIFAFMFTASPKQVIKILSSDREVKGYISSLAEAIDQGADKQVAGILGTLKNAIGLYNTPDIFWLLSKNEVNLNVNDPNNPTMLLIGNDSRLSDTYAPLCSLIITVASKLMNEPNKEKSVIIIDESPTIYLPNFEQIPATSRSNKIAVVVGAQDISQMKDKYGYEKAEILISNLGNQFFGRTTNKETAERVVKLFGQREDKVLVEGSSSGRLGRAIGYNDKYSQSQSIQKRDRIKIQQMTTLNAGEFAGLMAEGNNKEFLEQIQLQKVPESIGFPERSDYTPVNANTNFEEIYVQMENFISDSKGKSKPKSTGEVSDMDF